MSPSLKRMRDVRQIVFSCTEYLDSTDEVDNSILPDAIVLAEEGEMKDWDLSPRGA